MNNIITETLTKEQYTQFAVKNTVNPLPYLVILIEDDSLGTEYNGGAYITQLPTPSAYSCAYKELCGASAGRTEDMKMNKMVIGNYVELSVGYAAMNTGEMSDLLNTFKDEYVSLYYFNPLRNAYEYREFYTSEKSVPMYNGKLGLWDKFSMTFTQRTADSIYSSEASTEEVEAPNENNQ